MTEATVTENTAPAADEAVPATPVLANLSDADPFVQNLVPVLTAAINSLNEVRTKNAARTKGLDEIIADLKETSTNEKVVSLREKRSQIDEAIAKAVTDEAKAIKENAGEPDLDAEKNAKQAYDGLVKAMSAFVKPADIAHFLPNVVGGSAHVRGTSGNTGPKNDVSAIRTWAKENGFPDVKDRGRLSEDIVDAYNKAHASA